MLTTNTHRSLNKKYQTLYKKVKRAIQNGRFERYTTSKKAALLRRLGRYERRLLQEGVAVAGIAALMLHAAPLQAQVPAPAGVEFRVNETTFGEQRNSSVAIDSDGDFIVVWQSYAQIGGNSYDIYAQRYDKHGNAVDTEFRVNETTLNGQRNCSIAVDSDGDFIVVWESYAQTGGNDYDIYAQRYDKHGNVVDTEFRINTYTTNRQFDPSVGMDSDGNFVIAWVSDGQDGDGYGIYVQRYDKNGNTTGNEFQVNTYTTYDQRNPSIGVDSDGDFVITWESGGQDGSGYGIYARRYDKHGNAVDDEFRVNTFTTDHQVSPSVGLDNDGDFIIAWRSGFFNGIGQDGSRFGIYAQRYDRNGSSVGSEFQVNTYTTDYQSSPSVVVDRDGDFVITWQSGSTISIDSGQDGSLYGVYAQRYSKDGSTIGTEFQVNTYTTNSQFKSSIGMDQDGDFVITWQSYGQDGSSYGIYAQRYENALPSKSDEFRVNTTTINRQRNSGIAVDSDGDFVVVWESYSQTGGDDYDIYAQRYDKYGNVVDTEFRINTYTTNNQSDPSVAMDSNGNFIITWESFGQDGNYSGIYAQRYKNDGSKDGGEFQVNTYTTRSQRFPSVALDSDGDFVIAWQSYLQDGDGYGIYARRYTNGGSTPGPEFQVNTHTTSFQQSPTIALDSDGDFVIAWQSFGQDGSDSGIYARQYTNGGSTPGAEFQVNTFTTNNQITPAIGVDSDGDFIIAWASFGQDNDLFGVYARRYNKDGTTNGTEFQINTTTINDQRFPTIAIDNDGDFVVAWQSFGQVGNGYSVYAQRYSSNDNPISGEFRVPTFTTNSSQTTPSVGLDNDGDFVIAWQSFGQDGSNYGIYARHYEDVELPQGTESLVNTYTTNNQSNPSVAVDSDGDYVIVWESYGQNGSSANDIYAQRYNKDGNTVGTEFRVNTFTTGQQIRPSVGMDSTGNFIITWQSTGQDGSGTGIYMRRYDNTGMATSNAEVQVNTFTTNNQITPAIGVDSDGDFVIVWESSGQDGDGDGIYAQRYNIDGTTNGAEFQVNLFTTSNQRFPNVGMDSDGDFVVTWSSGGFSSGSGYDVYAQRYTNSGSTSGAEFQVNTYTTDTQFRSKVAVDEDGDFVIVWDSFGQDGSNSGVYTRRYDNTGNPVEGEFLVNCYTTGYQGASNVGMDSDGDFVITWSSGYQDGSSYGIYAQRYDSNGDLIGEEFLVNSFTSNSQFGSSIGVDSDGDFVIAWQSGIFSSSSGQDGDGQGIYAQRYQGDKSTTICQTTLELPNETITIDTKYQAEQSITSQQVLAAPDAIISYTASNNITLKTGFHAQPGVNFTAKIAPVNCSSSLNEEVVESRKEEQAVVPTAEELSIALAPNPVSEVLQLRLDSQASGKATIQVIDLNGRIVLSQALSLSAGQQTIQLDVSQLAAGTYFLKVQVSEGITQSKFVKLQH